MKLRVIGCAGGFPLGNNGTSSYVLTSTEGDYHVLIDAGSGSALAIEKYMDVNKLNAVLVSHDHPDHTADLGIFQHLFLLKKPEPRHMPIPIYSHPNSEFAKLLVTSDSSEPKVYQADETLEIGPFSITFEKTVHPLECYAMRIEEKETGKVLVYTADSAWHEPLIEFAKDADLLVADANFSNEMGRNAMHMTAEEVGQLASQAKVKVLAATHLPPQADRGLIISQIAEALDEGVALLECYPGAEFNI